MRRRYDDDVSMTIARAGQPSAAERAAAGKALREAVPRSSHSAWVTVPNRSQALRIIADSSHGRVDHLIPLRNARMAESAFAFFRGSAGVMAADLATTPATGVSVQIGGDAHCLNFGAFATPERRLIFDLNDFDETHSGPWEWDVKRLVASLVLAARSIRLKDSGANLTALAAVRAYRLKMIDFAATSALDTWYAHIDAAQVSSGDSDERRKRRLIVDHAQAHSMQAALERYTVPGPAGRHFVDEPPLLYHPNGKTDGGFDVERVFATYSGTLAREIQVLFGRYRLVDHSVKVVGVGSIGTRCSVALLHADAQDYLILQIKQAQASVLEPYCGPSPFANHGERVVFGQRLMQSASDAFLGWGTSGEHDYYVRQFKDKKGSVDIGAMDGYGLRDYAEMCGRALASAHARSGDAVRIAAYLGKSDVFDKAIVRFGLLYAGQAESDHETFVAAIDAGRIPVG